MSVVWITGTSGSGKSSVCEALREKGHHAVDADWDGFNHWVHRLTGEVVINPPFPVPPRWLKEFAWKIKVERVRELAETASSGVAFLCGSVENEVEVWQYFSQVVCLVADDETIIHRLATRTTNEFGKHPEELAAVLEWNQTVEARYRQLGASIVRAEPPLPEVVGEVLAVVGLE